MVRKNIISTGSYLQELVSASIEPSNTCSRGRLANRSLTTMVSENINKTNLLRKKNRLWAVQIKVKDNQTSMSNQFKQLLCLDIHHQSWRRSCNGQPAVHCLQSEALRCQCSAFSVILISHDTSKWRLFDRNFKLAQSGAEFKKYPWRKFEYSAA